MRRKIIKSAISILLSATFLGLAITTFSGCEQVSDFIPESYGEWDGNYVYRENYRSKTTGEDGEVLVSKVVDEGVAYEIKSCYDFYYYGDLIYLALRGEIKNEDESLSKRNFLVRYNAKEKTQETVISSSVEESLDWISYVNDERIVLDKDDSYYAIDLNGNPIEEEFPSSVYRNTKAVAREYLVYQEDGEIFCRSFADPTEYKILDMDIYDSFSDSYRFNLIEEGERKGLSILRYGREYNSYGMVLYDFYYYDLTENTLHTIEKNFQQKITWVDDEQNYFISFDMSEVNWVEKAGSCSVRERSVNVPQNCKLYAVNYKDLTMNEVYEFEPDRNCYKTVVAHDGRIFIDQIYYQSYEFMKTVGGEFDSWYLFNPEDGTVTLAEEEKIEAFDGFVHSKKVTCGAYEYYVASKNISRIWYLCYVYKFVRTNGETTETMQFWSTEGGEKACIEMWGEDDDFNDFIVLPY